MQHIIMFIFAICLFSCNQTTEGHVHTYQNNLFSPYSSASRLKFTKNREEDTEQI